MAANSRTAISGRRTKTWLIGVYIRLSKEDARHLDESESVTNQRSIIEDYIASMDDGDEYRIVDEYVDAPVIIGLKTLRLKKCWKRSAFEPFHIKIANET